MIYLDYAATTPLDPQVLREMLPYLTECYGNADSLHSEGRRAAYAVTCARDRIAQVFGVKPNEVYFTSGGTEADNWAVRCLSAPDSKNGVAISAIEHHAVLGAGEHVLREGRSLVRIPVTGAGAVTVDGVREALSSDTGVVCVQAVNNETGVVQPIREIAALCREQGKILFSDCVQAACSQDLKELAGECDALSVSAHKVYGPKGVGALIVKNGTPLSPLLSGGEQERNLRGGTLNVAAIVGFSYALEFVQKNREAFCTHTRTLRDYFESLVKNALGERVRVDGENRAPNVSHLTVLCDGGEAALNRLDLAGVAASGGAACAAHSVTPSHVMLAMGASEKEARSGLRFSFGRSTTKEEVEEVARILTRIILG